MDRGESYLRHQSHVNNIAAVLPMIQENFSSKYYIELHFFGNLALKLKHEVQEAHFSGKHYSLHCSIVEPGENKYVYHLSDNTNHDSVIVNDVLQDIFKSWNMKDETIIIKSDNTLLSIKINLHFNPWWTFLINTMFGLLIFTKKLVITKGWYTLCLVSEFK